MIHPPTGLLKLPGFQGTIEIRYDLTKGTVDIENKNPMAYAQLVQVLLVAVQGAVNQWAQVDARVIRQKPQEGVSDGNTEKAGDTKDDDHNG